MKLKHFRKNYSAYRFRLLYFAGMKAGTFRGGCFTFFIFFLFFLFWAESYAQVRTDSAHFQYDAYLLTGDEDAQQKVTNNILVRAEPSKEVVYTGEPLQLVYRVYTRLSMNARAGKLSAFPGFTSLDIVPEEIDIKPEYFLLGGQVYKSMPARIVRLIPLAAGIQTIPSLSINGQAAFFRSHYTLEEMARMGMQDGSSETVNFTVSSERVTVRVLPMPPPPPGAGAHAPIGRFKMEWRIQQSANELLPDTVEIVFTGEGNFGRIVLPEVNWPAGILPFEAEESSSIDSLAHPMKGYKKFSIPVTVERDGVFAVPGLTVWFFDANERKYYPQSTAELRFEARANAGKQAAGPGDIPQKEPTDVFSEYAPFLFFGLAVLLTGIFALIWRKPERGDRKKRIRQVPDMEVWLEQDAEKKTATEKDTRAFVPRVAASKWNDRLANLGAEIGLKSDEPIDEFHLNSTTLSADIKAALLDLRKSVQQGLANDESREKELDDAYFRLLYQIESWKRRNE